MAIIIIIKDWKIESDTVNNRDNWNHLKSFRKYLSNIPEKDEINKQQIKYQVLHIYIRNY
jgi:hypothetical protein